jgi:thymidylate kinase
MPFIAFLGCDGSGKSAVIDGLAARLTADGHAVTHGHWRPKPFATGDNPSSPAADNPHGQHPRGVVSSILKLGWLWLNWWVAWFQFVRRDCRRGYLLFDRYHGDLLADPKRYRYGGPMFLARLASRCMPQPDHVIFLDAAPDVLLARKQEVSREALEKGRAAYLLMARSNRRVHIIDATPSLDTVIDRVLDSFHPSKPH